MKFKRLWKLYKELRRLRLKVKVLEADLCKAKRMYNDLFYKKPQEVPYDTMTITMPNIHRIEVDYGLRDAHKRPVADYMYKRMSDTLKIKLVDDLFEQGVHSQGTG